MANYLTLDEYKDKYASVGFDRSAEGVLTVTFGTDGGPLVWSATAHEELTFAFADIANDRENACVVLTGTGDAWASEIDFGSFDLASAASWDVIISEGRRLLVNLIDIEVPVISAVNGPALQHPEIPVMSDVVILSETASFADSPHFASGIVPGDGAHIVWPYVLGPNRGRAFLLTGETIDAQTALSYGIAKEVVPADQVLSRAQAIATEIAGKPFLARRYARHVLTMPLKKLLQENLHHGLALEAAAVLDMLGAAPPAPAE